MPGFRSLADLVVVVHAVYAGLVVFGMLAIWLGLAVGWRWARNFWLRTVHLAMIAVVALEAMAGVVCPLTDLENYFRKLAGASPYAGSFLGEMAHRLLFYDAPQWVFSVAHCLFGAAVLATYLAAPPALARSARPLDRSAAAANDGPGPFMWFDCRPRRSNAVGDPSRRAGSLSAA